MSKQVYQIVIVVLLVLVGYLIYDGQEKEPDSNIQFSEPVMTDTESSESMTDKPSVQLDEAQSEVVTDDTVTLEGVYVGLVDGKEPVLGSFKYALIDDGTEMVRVDLRSIVGYDVTGLEDELGVVPGQRVTVKGYLENGEFVATLIK